MAKNVCEPFALCWLLALLLLPHFLSGKPAAAVRVLPYRRSRRPRLVLATWSLAMLVLAVMAFKINCVGDLRQVNLVPESLQTAENSLKSVWGEVRSRALVFAQGDTLEEALQQALGADVQVALKVLPGKGEVDPEALADHPLARVAVELGGKIVQTQPRKTGGTPHGEIPPL